MTSPDTALVTAVMRKDGRTLPAQLWEVRVPKWADIADDLRAAITAGTYPVDSKIPSYRDLRRDLGVADATVRRAIAALVDEGVLVRRHGFGVTVKALPGEARRVRGTVEERLDDHERRLRALEEGR